LDTIREQESTIRTTDATEPQTPTYRQQRSLRYLIIIGLFGLGLGFTISLLDPFTYNEKVRVLAPPGYKNTTLGLITVMALVVALIVQPWVGQWSDRTHSRWGKRAPFLTAGVIGISFSLILVVVADSLWTLVVAAMLVSTFFNTIQAAWQPLIPDQVPEPQHGTSAGIKTVLELIGLITGIIAVGFMLSRGNLWGAPLLAMALLFIILLTTLLTLRRSPSLATSTPNLRGKNPLRVLLSTLRNASPAFHWWMLNRFLFWSSAIAVRTFMLNYLEDVLGLSAAEAQALGSRLLVILGAGVLILALPAGAVADRIGRRPILIAAGIMAATGATGFIFTRDLFLLFVAGGLIAAGTGIFASASWALATDLAPLSQGALYLALANSATVVGSIGGRLGGPVIDGVNQLLDTAALGYMVVFAISALFFLGSSLVVLKMPERKKFRESAIYSDATGPQ
jgi:MFS family permease